MRGGADTCKGRRGRRYEPPAGGGFAINGSPPASQMRPALAGKRGCPLRHKTIEAAKRDGLPIVDNPPDAATVPSCCTNTSGTVSDRFDAMRKHQQPHYYWGSEQR